MIEFGDTTFYIDINQLDKIVSKNNNKKTDKKSVQLKKVFDSDGNVSYTEELTTIIEEEGEINPVKFEIINLMLDVVMATKDEMDTSLGVERALENTDLPFKIAFNTLYNYNIIKEK